jgi:hypothetical protein
MTQMRSAFRQWEGGVQQVGPGAVVEPVAVEAPFAAGIDQAVKDEGLEDQIPVCPLSAGWEFFAPEVIKAGLFPEFATEPAGPPLAGAFEAHFGEADAHIGYRWVVWTGQVFFGKERYLAGGLLVMIEEFHGLAPWRLLEAVEFAEVEHVALEDSSASDAAAFNDAPVVMFLAVLPALLAAQKHDRITPWPPVWRQWGGSALQALFETDHWKIKGSSV